MFLQYNIDVLNGIIVILDHENIWLDITMFVPRDMIYVRYIMPFWQNWLLWSFTMRNMIIVILDP